MNTTVNERVKEIADTLCDGDVLELARVVGVDEPILSNIIGAKQLEPCFETLTKIADCATLNIDAEWLLTGKGHMQPQAANIDNNAGDKVIPVYNLYAVYSLQALFEKDNTQHIIGHIKIPNAPDCEGAVCVRGYSMHPLVKSGDTVAYKQMHSLESLIEGEVYVLEFEQDKDLFIMVKYVKWDEKNTTLCLYSYNEQYGDIIIPVSALRAIAHVKIVLGYNSTI